MYLRGGVHWFYVVITVRCNLYIRYLILKNLMKCYCHHHPHVTGEETEAKFMIRKRQSWTSMDPGSWAPGTISSPVQKEIRNLSGVCTRADVTP